MFNNITEKITSPIANFKPLSRKNTGVGAETEPWHHAFPEPRHKNDDIQNATAEDVLGLLKEGKKSGEKGGFLLVDVRRNDHEGGTIRGSLNLPAQSLYYSLSTLMLLCQNAQIKEVAFYCGSSSGRGPRCAGWFADYLVDHGVEENEIRAVVLEGGIKGWVKGGKEYISWVDGYDAKAW